PLLSATGQSEVGTREFSPGAADQSEHGDRAGQRRLLAAAVGEAVTARGQARAPGGFQRETGRGRVNAPAEIIPHRGASYVAPENTLCAIRAGWDEGADAVESDFRLTRDGQIVAIHDESTRRTAGVEGLVAQQTLAELQSLDVGQWKDVRYRGERIPTLAD